MGNVLFFYRKRGFEDVLQTLQWKSFSDATGADKEQVLKLLGSGDYVQTTAFIPAGMVKGGEKDD